MILLYNEFLYKVLSKNVGENISRKTWKMFSRSFPSCRLNDYISWHDDRSAIFTMYIYLLHKEEM